MRGRVRSDESQNSVEQSSDLGESRLLWRMTGTNLTSILRMYIIFSRQRVMMHKQYWGEIGIGGLTRCIKGLEGAIWLKLTSIKFLKQKMWFQNVESFSMMVIYCIWDLHLSNYCIWEWGLFVGMLTIENYK
jgi:hypothetical protein